MTPAPHDSAPRGGRLSALAALAAVGLLASSAAACGEKPKPRPTPAASAPPPATAASAGPTSNVAITAGGVTLDDATAPSAKAALTLATSRPSAVKELIAAGPAAAPTAMALLTSVNLEELRGALEYFAEVPSAAAAPAITRLLKHDAAAVRDAARLALVATGGDALVTSAVALLDSPSPGVRVDAARTLATVDGAGLAAPKLQAMLSDPDPAVVAEAAIALARVGGELDEAALTAMITSADAPAATRQAALLVARRRGVAVPAEAVRSALAGDVIELAAEAARALQVVPEAERGALVDQALADARPAVRRAVAEALGHASSPALAKAGLAATRKLASDPDPTVRAASLYGLARGGDDDVARVKAALGDESALVRRAAAATLASMPGGQAAIIAALDKEQGAATKRFMVKVLGAIPTRASLLAIAAELTDTDIQDEALLALGRIAQTVEYELDAAKWRGWIDAHYPPPAPPGDKAPDAPK